MSGANYDGQPLQREQSGSQSFAYAALPPRPYQQPQPTVFDGPGGASSSRRLFGAAPAALYASPPPQQGAVGYGSAAGPGGAGKCGVAASSSDTDDVRKGLVNDYVQNAEVLERRATEDVPTGEMLFCYGEETPRIGPESSCFVCGERCAEGNPGYDFFRPCECPEKVFHRGCFCHWRQGWINPRNYFSCPDCMQAYNIERVREENDDLSSREAIRRNYRIAVAKMWGATLLAIVALVAFVAIVAYFADRSHKNIPVMMKYLFTSVVGGFPDSSSEDKWRAEFKDKDKWVWQYYTLLGALVTAVVILVGFVFLGCKFDSSDRPHRPCSQQCSGCVCYDPCPGPYYGNTTCCICVDTSDNCCSGCGGGCGGGCGSCGGCDGGCGSCSGGDCKLDCKGGGGEAVLIIIAVVIIVVILSAVILVILFAIRKTMTLHDRMTDMLENQAKELDGETLVLGRGESVRPIGAV